MNKFLITGVMLILAVLTLSCSSPSHKSPYNDPDSQRERAREAQDEMRRDMQ